uniref:transposase n=1 Tax=Cellulosilyticum ruminicola TaxID=425254 RepID=UPI002E8E22CB|nr:transposase [Cellulosilyticum ruminicola]
MLTDEGCKLRMNRSIQAEGSFANIKGDMSFRRYLCRGQKNVLAESILLAMAHNINKLDHKIQNGSTGTYLFEMKKEA